MKLPLKLLLQKGRVLVIDIHFSNINITKTKYLVILNKSINDPVLYILPTSQVAPYKTKYKHKNHFVLEKGASKSLTKESVFDFENIMELSLNQFEQLYGNCLVEAKDILEPAILDKIDKHVTQSKTIEKYKKKIILGERSK